MEWLPVSTHALPMTIRRALWAGGLGRATDQNVLWGDYFRVDPQNNFSTGDQLVRLEAVPGRFERVDRAQDARNDLGGDETGNLGGRNQVIYHPSLRRAHEHFEFLVGFG